MSEHATPAVQAAPGHADHGHAADEGLRFEKSEYQFFIEDDQHCGAAIGKLLAATFCVLVVLMSGVALWTNRHQFTSQDTFQDIPSAQHATGGH